MLVAIFHGILVSWSLVFFPCLLRTYIYSYDRPTLFIKPSHDVCLGHLLCLLLSASIVITSRPVGEWSIVISMSVCLHCLLTYPKDHLSKFHKFSLHVNRDRGSVLLCISVLWMTSCFHIMGPAGQNQAWVQVAVPGAKLLSITVCLLTIWTNRHHLCILHVHTVSVYRHFLVSIPTATILWALHFSYFLYYASMSSSHFRRYFTLCVTFIGSSHGHNISQLLTLCIRLWEENDLIDVWWWTNRQFMCNELRETRNWWYNYSGTVKQVEIEIVL